MISRAGGMAIRTWITEEPLESVHFLKGLGSHADGAVLLFLGRVREVNEGRRVARLDYEVYREMAESELQAIVEEVAREFEVGAIAAAHRVGMLELGEISVGVAVAAPHREACYEASRAVIEAVKTRLPVWKREEYSDGSTFWVGSEEDEEERGGLRPGKGAGVRR